jgi:hypothetical protein
MGLQAYCQQTDQSCVVTVHSVYSYLTNAFYDPNNTLLTTALAGLQLLRDLQQVMLAMPELELRSAGRLQGFIKRQAREQGAKRKR